MSTARELFSSALPLHVPGNDDAYEKLSRAAELWRSDGQHFSAGVCMMDACHAAWGRADRILDAMRMAVADLERVIAEEPQSAPASIAALYKLRQAAGNI